MKQSLHKYSFQLFKKPVRNSILIVLVLVSSQMATSQVIADQNFNTYSDPDYAAIPIDLDGISYSGSSGADTYIAVDNSLKASPNTQMSGTAMIIGNNSSEVNGYAEFKTINSATNFKLVSLVIETYSLAGGFDSEYQITGFDNGTAIVSVKLDMITSGTYGLGDDAIVYNRNMASTAGGSTSGVFTFGDSWDNIDHIRFQTISGTENYYYVALDTIDFEPAVVPNSLPTVSDVTFSGTLQVGELLTASYNYNDSDNDTDGSTYQWFRSDDMIGTNKSVIDGASLLQYSLVEDDEDTYISFEVSSYDGTNFGAKVESDLLGPVLSKTLSVEDLEYNDSVIAIYPNPVHDTFTVNNLKNSKITKIEIYNLNGSLVKTRILNAIVSQVELNIENLVSGIYLVYIHCDKDIKITKKLMVN